MCARHGNLLHENVRNDGDTEEEVAEPEQVDDTHQAVVHQLGAGNEDGTKENERLACWEKSLSWK